MMTEYILQSFRERVNAMSWLSEFSKQRTIEKVEAITLQAAYPLQIFDNDYVNGLYSTVSKDQFTVLYSLPLPLPSLSLSLFLALTTEAIHAIVLLI